MGGMGQGTTVVQLWLVLLLLLLHGSLGHEHEHEHRAKIFWECKDGLRGVLCLCYQTPGFGVSKFQASDASPPAPHWSSQPRYALKTTPQNNSYLANSRCALVGLPLEGGIGNIMGFFASIQGYARRQGRPVWIDGGYQLFLRRVFPGLSLPTITVAALVEYLPTSRFGLPRNYPGGLMEVPGKPFVIQGYALDWQPFAFEPLMSELRHQFRLPQKSVDHARSVLQAAADSYHLNSSDCVYVGVHVRRGDYLAVASTIYKQWLASATYLEEAIQYFTARYHNAIFMVASEDLAWCKANLNSTRHRIYFPDPQDVQQDLAMLTSCNHTIMSFGTFGWWAAWLTNGVTVYMKKYFYKPGDLNSFWNWDTFYPKNWVGIDVSKFEQVPKRLM